MKKSLIILSSCVSFLLAGCSFNQTPSDVVSETGSIQTGVLPEITGSVENIPLTISNPATLQLKTEPLTIRNDEDGISKESFQKYSSQLRDCLPIQDPYFTDYICKEMRGYKHTYFSPELGIKISYKPRDLNPIDLTEFFEEDPKLLAVKDAMIYDQRHPEASIKKIEKDPTQSREQFVKTLKHGSCEYKRSDSLNSDMIVYSTEECGVETNGFTIYSDILFSKTKTSYFYQEMYMDGCAPGACTSFEGTKEYFLK